MRTDRRLIYLGLFLLVFGGVLLAARQGWIPEDVVAALWQLWPVLLIATGLSIILSGRPGAWLGGIVASVCLGAMAAAVVQTGFVPFIGCGGDAGGSAFQVQDGQLASNADVDLTFSCGELDVATGAGRWLGGRRHVRGRPHPERPGSPTAAWRSSRPDGACSGSAGRASTGTSRCRPSRRSTFGLTLNAGAGRIDLSGAQLTDVDLTVNAGSLSLDLRDVTGIEDLDGTVNAGSSVTWLPDLPLTGSLTVNAGSLVICAPEGLGLRLETGDNPISSNDFERAGLVRTDDGWETPDYASAEVKTQLDVTANAGSLSLNPGQPCDR